MFPADTTPNQAIYITGTGASVGFSTLITDATPDLHILSGGRAFPRYTFARESKRTKRGPSGTASLINLSDAPDEKGGIDNITDWCHDQFQQHYGEPTITKDDIWAYLYGMLHALDWRKNTPANSAKTYRASPSRPTSGHSEKPASNLSTYTSATRPASPGHYKSSQQRTPTTQTSTALTAPCAGERYATPKENSSPTRASFR